MTWDPEIVERIRHLWDIEAKTSADIAEMFGCTRNAIIGLAHRNHFRQKAKRPPVIRSKVKRGPKPKPKLPPVRVKSLRDPMPGHNITAAPRRPVKLPSSHWWYARANGHKLPPAATSATVAPDTMLRLPLLDLVDGLHCKYPLTNGSPWLFCGLRQVEPSCYCRYHAALCGSKAIYAAPEPDEVAA